MFIRHTCRCGVHLPHLGSRVCTTWISKWMEPRRLFLFFHGIRLYRIHVTPARCSRSFSIHDVCYQLPLFDGQASIFDPKISPRRGSRKGNAHWSRVSARWKTDKLACLPAMDGWVVTGQSSSQGQKAKPPKTPLPFF